MRALVGIVGYVQFLRAYPLGPELMAALRGAPWASEVDVREMNWGPIAIVQDLQAEDHKPERVVLVGGVDRGLAPGTVTCRRWSGAKLDPLAVQRRVFEGVTGVISLDNLVVIGAHFGVWPEPLLTVELQSQESDVSDLVLDEIEANRSSDSTGIIGERPMSEGNRRIVAELVETIRRATQGDNGPDARPLTAELLTTPAQVIHHRFAEEPLH